EVDRDARVEVGAGGDRAERIVGQRADRWSGRVRRGRQWAGESERGDEDDRPDRGEEGQPGCDRPPGEDRQIDDREDGNGQGRGGDLSQYDSLLLGFRWGRDTVSGCRSRTGEGATAATLARGSPAEQTRSARGRVSVTCSAPARRSGGRSRTHRSGDGGREATGRAVASVGRRREPPHLE